MPISKASGQAVAPAAKGDLVVGSATNDAAVLGVGANGETIVANSSASVGLSYRGDYAAGKNALINGDFKINQRGFTSITASDFGFDRWRFVTSDGTVTHTPQTFTPGAAPVAGYEGATFARIQTTGQTAAGAIGLIRQRIESVRTFAGQTITVSFWAKAASGTPNIVPEFIQNFGTGGSPTANVEGILASTPAVTISSSWTRYTKQVTIPSISGKTLGTTNDGYLELAIWVSAGTTYNSRTGSLGIQTNTFDIWGVQIESGSVATAFQTSTGTLAGELAACQRYYYRFPNGDYAGTGLNYSTTRADVILWLPVPMRGTVSWSAPTGTYRLGLAGTTTTQSTVSAFYSNASPRTINASFQSLSGLTAGQANNLYPDATGSYIEASAEL